MEKVWWENIISGDKENYSIAYRFYYKKLFNYGKKFTEDGPMIEDSINEVFFTIWKTRDNLHKVYSPQSYIFTSFRNNIFKKIKSAKLITGDEDHREADVQFAIDTIIIQRETEESVKNEISRAIQELTPRQREAIFLRFYEGLSYSEIADVINISVKATYKLMARALSEMKDILAKLTVYWFALLLKLF